MVFSNHERFFFGRVECSNKQPWQMVFFSFFFGLSASRLFVGPNYLACIKFAFTWGPKKSHGSQNKKSSPFDLNFFFLLLGTGEQRIPNMSVKTSFDKKLFFAEVLRPQAPIILHCFWVQFFENCEIFLRFFSQLFWFFLGTSDMI